jgi:hypothetical protein
MSEAEKVASRAGRMEIFRKSSWRQINQTSVDTVVLGPPTATQSRGIETTDGVHKHHTRTQTE